MGTRLPSTFDSCSIDNSLDFYQRHEETLWLARTAAICFPANLCRSKNHKRDSCNFFLLHFFLSGKFKLFHEAILFFFFYCGLMKNGKKIHLWLINGSCCRPAGEPLLALKRWKHSPTIANMTAVIQIVCAHSLADLFEITHAFSITIAEAGISFSLMKSKTWIIATHKSRPVF